MEPLRINGTAVPIRNGKHSTVGGRRARHDLNKLELELATRDQDMIDEIEGWNNQQVQVTDPTGHVFDAHFRVKQSSYSNQSPVHTYQVELTEVDKPPHVAEIELNGQTLQVERYTEDADEGSDGIRTALLRLTSEQFQWLRRSIADRGTVTMRCVGIDDEPSIFRYGRLMYWSQDQENDPVTYYHIVRFIPEGKPNSKLSDLPLFGFLSIMLERTITQQAYRVEALTALLVEKQLLSQDEVNRVLEQAANEEIDVERRSALLTEQDKIDDAADFFDKHHH